MALLKVVAVFDSAVESFGQPFFVPALGAATRSFVDEVNNPESQFFKHPSDFELYHLCDFESASGEFRADARPILLLRARDCFVNDK